jgi:hypothetical protein
VPMRRAHNTIDRVPADESEARIAFEVSGEPPLATVLRAFSRARTRADRLPPEALSDFGGTPVSDANFARSRLLASAFGVRIYGVPADDGSVCWAAVPGGSATCEPVVYHGGYPHLDAASNPRRVLVVGLAANDITGVDVQVRGRWHRAWLGRNAYVYELPLAVHAPRSVVVREPKGAKHTFDFVG